MKKTILLFAIVSGWIFEGYSQCFPDRHSTNFFDGWVSCETAENPNSDRGKGHFIMYDFGKVYRLGQMQVWNSNDPAHLDWGMRDVAIDFSLDGIQWMHAGDFNFSQASGLNTYEGEQGPYLQNIEARYLLITGLNNYGGSCYGIAEIKIEAEEVIISDVEDVVQFDCVEIAVYPNPFAELLTLQLDPVCSGQMRYSLYDLSGKMVFSQSADMHSGQSKSIDLGRDLPAGAYQLRLEYGGKSIQRSIVKINRT